jgi:hypothetical protein
MHVIRTSPQSHALHVSSFMPTQDGIQKQLTCLGASQSFSLAVVATGDTCHLVVG